MAPKFPNPPLAEIDPVHLVTVEQAAAHFGVTPDAIRQWVFIGKVERLPLDGGGPHLYHLLTLAHAELDAYNNGADRPIRGGRKPGWKPCAEHTRQRAGRTFGQQAA